MNEEKRNKREWVKSAAIIFLLVMLVLTFFSNTIMNYSLPEVATQRIQSGTITAKVRGTGTVESGEPYNIEVKQARKVASVNVRVGDQVEKGDILIYLEDEESTDLQTAIQDLKTLQDDFDKAILDGTVDTSTVNNVQNGTISSVTEYQKKITTAKTEMDNAQKVMDEAQAWVTALESQKSISSAVWVNTVAEEKALNEAKTALSNAELALENAKLALANKEIAISSGNAGDTTAEQKVVYDCTVIVNNAEGVVNEKQAALNAAKLKEENAQADSDNTLKNLEQQLAAANINLSSAKSMHDAKVKVYEALLKKIEMNFDLTTKLDAIRAQQEVVDKLREESIGATVTADIAGTVTSINATAGTMISPGTVVVLQPAGKGYTLSFSITNEQAKKISVGDPAELVNSWWYSDITATVAGIKPDTTDPTKKRNVTFDLTGELTAGQSLSLAVGQKSASYDMIVPNSAIREDNNGKFILIIEYKSSPLGTRYMATRVDVEVVASDDTQSAISGAVYGYEDVITTSTKPVEPGKQVRLPD